MAAACSRPTRRCTVAPCSVMATIVPRPSSASGSRRTSPRCSMRSTSLLRLGWLSRMCWFSSRSRRRLPGKRLRLYSTSYSPNDTSAPRNCSRRRRSTATWARNNDSQPSTAALTLARFTTRSCHGPGGSALRQLGEIRRPQPLGRHGHPPVHHRLQRVAVVPLIDVHRRFDPAVTQPERGEVTSVQLAPHDQFVAVRVGQPAVLAAEVVLVGEEVRRRLVRLRFADQVLPGPLPLA